MRYAIWNNKGGVGKTYFSFLLGAEIALANPSKNVILADMCPQANLSEVALGGNGKGSQKLSDILSKGAERRTIGGYFDRRISSPHGSTKTEATFLVKAAEFNTNAPENLFLLVGDPSLELQSQVMSQICAQPLPEDSWKNVHMWLHDLVTGCENHRGADSCVTIIDCNPSFAIYTEVAMLAADRLIVPCTSDGSSARAIDNVGALVYGHNSIYGKIGFPKKCKDYSLSPPLIQSIVLNRTTQWQKSAALAFKAMFDQIKERVFEFGKHVPDAFVDRKVAFGEMPDSHTATVVASYLGMPLSRLSPGTYEIKGKKVQLNPKQLERYTKAIRRLAASLKV